MGEIKGEVDHCRHRLLKYCKGQGLDLGCGRSKIRIDAISIDLHSTDADMNMDARVLDKFPDDHFDYVFSSNLLEEIDNTEMTLREWLRVLKPGGNIVLYQIEDRLYYPIGDPRCNRNHRHHFSKDGLLEIFRKIDPDIKLIHYAPPQNDEWCFEFVVKKPAIEKINENLTFRFMVVGGPAEPYIERCLESIRSQTYKNWTAQVVLDPVGDKTYEKAIKFQDDRIKVKLNETREYNISNFLKASKLLAPNDDDVLIMVDADDWLANPDVLKTLEKYYDDNSNLLVTHGSWAPYPKPAPNNNLPYSEQEFANVRKPMWRASHLRTCKYKIWKFIKEEDLKDEKGNFYTMSGDLALMYPMLEMAGYHRVKFIPEIMYVYNQETQFSDEKVDHKKQIGVGRVIQEKKPYKYRSNFVDPTSMNLVIFSKDRACQLELLLRSIKRHFKNWERYRFNVLYKASEPKYQEGYDIVKSCHPEFNYVSEKNFKVDVLGLVNPDNRYTMFGVDDNVFLDDFDMDCPEVAEFEDSKDIFSVSLRMHPKMNYCYPIDKLTEPPKFEKGNVWKWPGLAGDWAYPYSVDFNLFLTEDVINLLKSVDYNSPNTMEGRIAMHAPEFKKHYMSCFEKAKVVNIPANKVQSDNSNRHGDISQESLNEQFQAGKRIALFDSVPNHRSPHVEYNYQIIE